MEQNHMQQRDLPPPSYASHDPQTLKFPSVPVAEPPPAHHDRKLPPLPVTQPETRLRAEEHQSSWPSGNPLTAYYQPGPSHLSPKGVKPSNGLSSPTVMDLDPTDTRGRRGGSVVSIDDPDVRMAAEALGDLRADFVQSPPHNARTLPSPLEGSHPEPLLSLLTTSHPLIGNTINTSMSAYSASKNFSPRFKSGIEYVERRFTPVVNTVGSVGRLTGVEGGVRWFLGGRRPSHHAPSDAEGQEGSNKKRRKVGVQSAKSNEDKDEDLSLHQFTERQGLPHRQRAPSQASTVESLPAYDDQRSPSYESALVSTRPPEADSPGGTSWQSRLVLSTSGLSIAMSDESLRSLKYCLSWLKWANEHIDKVIHALKSVLEQYERGMTSGTIENGEDTRETQLIVRSEAERSALNAKINDLKKDVLKTLKEVVDIVSKYAGGALPENARILVRKHLTSLPQRFRLANSQSTTGQAKNEDTEVTDGARRVLVLAKEGLDMMSQVSGVLDGTIVSAEEWCERLGRTKAEDEAETPRSMASASREVEKLPIELAPIRTTGATEGLQM